MMTLKDFIIDKKDSFPLEVLSNIASSRTRGVAITGVAGTGKTEFLRCYSNYMASIKKYTNISTIDEVKSIYAPLFIVDILCNDSTLTLLFTAKFKTTDELINWFVKKANMDIYSIVKSIHYEIHLSHTKNIQGDYIRYIERITEITPSKKDLGYDAIDIYKSFR